MTETGSVGTTLPEEGRQEKELRAFFRERGVGDTDQVEPSRADIPRDLADDNSIRTSFGAIDWGLDDMLAPAPRRLELCTDGSVADVVYGEDVVARPLVPTVGKL